MAYVRVTSIGFSPDNVQSGLDLLRDLLDFLEKQEGYQTGFILRSAVDPNQFARVTFWANRTVADHAAMLDHVQSVFSRMNVIAAEGSHREDSYEVVGDPDFLKALVEG